MSTTIQGLLTHIKRDVLHRKEDTGVSHFTKGDTLCVTNHTIHKQPGLEWPVKADKKTV